MDLLFRNTDQNLIINPNSTFKTDLGWTENAEIMEKEILYQIINPIENYETARFSHKSYVSSRSVTQNDIWFHFNFNRYGYDFSNPLVPVLTGVTREPNYELADITLTENSKMLRQSTESFFRLEFYKTPNDEAPNANNRRMVFAKNLALPLGERIFYTGTTSGGLQPLNDYVYIPVFQGSNFRNKENMFLFWFIDDSPFSGTSITGNSFYMTAKFYNSKDGSVMDFTNNTVGVSDTLVEEEDLYYKVEIDRSDYTYQVFRFSGTKGSRIGESGDPIMFYERIR